MAQVQIDEAEFAQYQRLAGAARAMLDNPEARKHLHKAQKIVNPKAVIPEEDVREQVENEVQGLRGEMAKIAAQLAEEKAERDRTRQAAEITDGWEKQKRALRDQGFTEDGIEKIEAHALKESIPNLRAAANDYMALNPPPAPAAPAGQSWNFLEQMGELEKDTYVEKLFESHGDNEQLLNKEIAATLSDFRAQNRTQARR
jgi:hypothetical protein